jgi:hypothetical protein
VPQDYTEDGEYIPDNGKKYGETGKAFGWSRDMSSNIKQFNEAEKQELHSLVDFYLLLHQRYALNQVLYVIT